MFSIFWSAVILHRLGVLGVFLKGIRNAWYFRVHGPAGRHEQLVELLTPATEEQTIFDSPPAKRQKKP